MFNLPTELVQHIFEFCIDKRLSWNKLNQQFLKGGFNRKNLKLNRYLEEEQWCCKRSWEAARPELYWCKRNINFDYRHGEWSIKKKMVVVTLTTRSGLRNIWSAKEPVSRWFKNIKKFETSYPEYAKETYLPNSPSPIKIKGVSKFYVDLRASNKKKKKKEKENKAASLFMEERKQLKLDKCSFKKNQEVLLSFTMKSSGKLKFYRGWVNQIYLNQYLNPANGYRKIFSAPRGKNRFDASKIDNYIGELRIMIRFEDGDYPDEITWGIKQYTNHKLIERIQTSAKELIAKEKKEQEEKEEDVVTLDTIDINGVTYLHDPHGIYAGIKHLLLSEDGTPLGIYDKNSNRLIEQEFEVSEEDHN